MFCWEKINLNWVLFVVNLIFMGNCIVVLIFIVGLLIVVIIGLIYL